MSDPSLDIELEHRLEQLRSAPESRAFAPLADCYRRLRRHDDARRVCEAGIERHPTYVTAYVILARIHYEQGHEARARSVFERVLELDPQNLTAMRFLASAAERRGDDHAAIEYWRQVETFDPHDTVARVRREQLEVRSAESAPVALEHPLDEAAGLEEPKEIEAEAETAAEAPEQPASREVRVGQIATITLADIYYEQGFKAKALEIYRSVQRDAPGTPGVDERVVRIERELSDLQRRLEATRGGDPVEETLASLSDVLPPPVEPPATKAAEEAPAPSERSGGEADVDDFEHFRTWLGRIKARPF